LVPKFCSAISSEEQALAFSVHTGLVNMQNPLCPRGQRKFLTKQGRAANGTAGLEWVCSKKAGAPWCRFSRSILTNTWFQGIKIPMLSALELIVHWFYQVPVTAAAGQIVVSKETAVKWYDSCREVCINVLTRDDICIGGPGLHVEIDESHLWTRKYHRGRPLASEQTCVFGGICRETNESFITLVPNRTGATLWPIIH
jgi:hypothetical protein